MRQETLKNKGKFLECTQRIREWIEENMDRLWESEWASRVQKDPELANLTEERIFKEKMQHKRTLLN